MLASLIVPLQYHFRRWQARRAIAEAASSAGGPRHVRAIEDARKAVHRVEVLEIRFPDVAHRVAALELPSQN